MRIRRSTHALKLAAAAAASVLLAPLARAQTPTNTWTATTSGNWSDPTKWDAVPSSGAATVLQFKAATATSYTATNDIANPFQLNGVLLNSTSTNPIALAGGTLSFVLNGTDNPVLNQNGSGAALVTNPLTFAAATTLGGTGAGPVTLNGGLLTFTSGLTVNTAANVQVGALATTTGTGALTKQGAGTLSLAGGTGTPAWTGAINVQGGAVSVLGAAADASLGTGAKTITLSNGAAFRILGANYDPATGTKSFNFGSGGGAIDTGLFVSFLTNDANQVATSANPSTKTGPGVWQIGQASTGYAGYTGALTVDQGTARVLNANSLGGGSGAAVTVNQDGLLDVQVASFPNALVLSGTGLNGSGQLVNNSAALAGSTTGAVTAATGLIAGGGSATPQNLTLAGSLSVAAGGITKVGSNNLILQPALASTVSVAGPTSVQGGTLTLNFANNNGPIVDATQPLNLSSTGTLAVVGNASAATVVNVSALNLGAGQGTVSVTTGSGQSAGLNLGAIAPAAGGTVNFTQTSTGGGTPAITTTNLNSAGGILGGWAVFGGTTWAVNSTNAAGAPIAGLADGSYAANTFAANQNTNLAASQTPGAPVTTHSIRVNPAAAGAVTLTLPAGDSVIETGGILVNPVVGANAVLITGGTLLTPSGGGQPDLYVHQGNTGGDTTIASVIGSASNNAFGVTKAGTGRLVLGGTNLFNGPVTVGNGTLRGTVARAFGPVTNVVTIAGATSTLELHNAASTNFDNDVVVASAVLPGSINTQATINVNRTGTTATNQTHRIGDLTIGDQTLQVSGSNGFTLNVGGATTLLGNPTLNNGVTLTLTGVVSDGAASFGITKVGSATLILPNANTFDGGVVITAGAIRATSNSATAAGVVASGPFGTGTLTVNNATISEGDGDRAFQNDLVIAGPASFSATTTANVTGSITFDSAGLTTPATVQLIATNPTITTSTPTTFANSVSGMSVTKAGAAPLVFAANNTYTGTTTVSAGTLQFNAPFAIGGAGRSVTVASTATAAAGYAIDQAFLDRIATASAGVAALAADSANPLDFSAFPTLRLGAAADVTYSGTLTPNGTTYRLGGGGSAITPVIAPTLTVNSALTGAGNAVDVGANGTTAGAVALANGNNAFTGITVNAGGALILNGPDGAPGSPTSIYGAVPAAPTVNVTLNGGTLRLGASGQSLNANRTIALVGSGAIDTAGFTSTILSAFSGTGTLVKAGTGTLRLTQPDVAALNVTGATAAAVSVLDLDGQSLTTGSLTVTGLVGNASAPAYVAPNQPTALYSVLTDVGNLTVNGPVLVGADSPGLVAITPGGSLTFNAGSGNVIIGQITAARTASALIPGVVDASQAATATVNAANLFLGVTATNATATTFDGNQTGTLLLPRAATGTATIDATTMIQVGGSVGNGGGGVVSRVVMGAGATAVTTPTLALGQQREGGVVAFNDGTNYFPRGTLTLAGDAAGGARVDLDVARNVSPVTPFQLGTSTTPASAFDMMGGTLRGPVTETNPDGYALFDAVRLGYYDAGASGTSNGGATGAFVLDGRASRADINSVTLAQIGTITSGSRLNVRGVFVVNEGVARLNGAIAPAGTAFAGVNVVSVFGGTLNMQGNDLGAAGANQSLNGTEVATNPGMNVTGGTLLNAGTVYATAHNFNHSGGTVARAAAGTTAVTGNYNLTSQAPLTSYAGQNVTLANLGAPAVGGATIRLDSAAAGGNVAVTSGGALARATAGATLNVVPVAGALGAAEKVVFTTTPATVATSTATPMVPPYAVAQGSGANLAGDYLTHDATNGLVPLTYSAAASLSVAGATDVFNATAPQTTAGAVTVLALRASADVTLGGTLTVGAAAAPAGVIVNAATITGGTLAFGGREAVVYAGGGGTGGTIASPITGTAGATFFGNSVLSITSASPGLSGNVRINGGVIAANNSSGSALGTGAVTVGSGGTLAGGAATAAASFTGTTGFVTGAVTVNRFGTVAPGNSVGTLTTGAATLAGGSILAVEVDTANLVGRTGPTPADVNVNDRLRVNGALTLTGATNYNPITIAADGGGGTYDDPDGYDFYLVLANSIAGFAADKFVVEPTNFGPGPNTYAVAAVGNALVLTVIPVPEPTTFGCAALAATAGLLARRRRRA